MAKVRKKVSKTKESERVGRSRNKITTRSRKESLKKTEYSARRFVDSKDHKRRCIECRSRYFLRLRERNVLCSFLGLKGGKSTALNHEEMKRLAIIIAKRCRDQVDIENWKPNWKDIASEFFEIKKVSDKKVNQLRYLWKINFLSVKDVCLNIVFKSSDISATPNFSNRVDPNDDINGGINGRYASNSEECKNPKQPDSRVHAFHAKPSIASFVGNIIGAAIASLIKGSTAQMLQHFISTDSIIKPKNELDQTHLTGEHSNDGLISRILCKVPSVEQEPCKAADPVRDSTKITLLDGSEKDRNKENVILSHTISQMENCFRPRVQDEGDDIFESVGTSATTMGIMSGSNLPKSGMFYADCV